MPAGLFGKLPVKRDFVALNLPRKALGPLETWLQSGVAASRNELGRGWQDHYLVAPIWRFFIGREIVGATFMGAIMPSVDSVGRFFPLAVGHYGDAEGGQDPAPPTLAPRDAWFEGIEARLLETLGEEFSGTVESLLSGIDAPPDDEDADGNDGDDAREEASGRRHRAGMVFAAGPDADTAAFLRSAEHGDHRFAAAGRSYWWTRGSERFGPILYSQGGMPDPYLFTRMITGDFQ